LDVKEKAKKAVIKWGVDQAKGQRVPCIHILEFTSREGDKRAIYDESNNPIWLPYYTNNNDLSLLSRMGLRTTYEGCWQFMYREQFLFSVYSVMKKEPADKIELPHYVA